MITTQHQNSNTTLTKFFKNTFTGQVTRNGWGEERHTVCFWSCWSVFVFVICCFLFLGVRGFLTKIELLMLEWPLAGDCLEVLGDSFWNKTHRSAAHTDTDMGAQVGLTQSCARSHTHAHTHSLLGSDCRWWKGWINTIETHHSVDVISGPLACRPLHRHREAAD